MFEQIDFPVQPLMDAEIRKGDLNAAYDAIILPADSIAAMTGETPPGGEGGRGARSHARRRQGRRHATAVCAEGF
jgi:hypothetical protein